MHLLASIAIVGAGLFSFVHGWYPTECCGQHDCKPIACDQLVETRNGWLYLPTGNEFTPYQVRPSQDRYCHVCLGQTDKRSLCAFILSGV